MSENFEIKKLDSADLKFAREFFRFFKDDDGEENPTFLSDAYLTKLLKREDFHVFVALEDGKFAGGLTAYELMKYNAETTEMFLYEIGVEPEYQRRGIAAALVERLKAVCAEKGIREMFVATEPDNLPALGLYEKTGGKASEFVNFDYVIE